MVIGNSININKDNAIVGIEIKQPYFTNCPNEYFTSFCFNIFINIMPAKEPIGVNKAQILEAATTEQMVELDNVAPV